MHQARRGIAAIRATYISFFLFDIFVLLLQSAFNDRIKANLDIFGLSMLVVILVASCFYVAGALINRIFHEKIGRLKSYKAVMHISFAKEIVKLLFISSPFSFTLINLVFHDYVNLVVVSKSEVFQLVCGATLAAVFALLITFISYLNYKKIVNDQDGFYEFVGSTATSLQIALVDNKSTINDLAEEKLKNNLLLLDNQIATFELNIAPKKQFVIAESKRTSNPPSFAI